MRIKPSRPLQAHDKGHRVISAQLAQIEVESAPPPIPCASCAVGVTGHRASHPSFPADASALEAVLDQVFAEIDAALTQAQTQMAIGGLSPTRLLTLMADGTDHLAAQIGLARGWELVAPLPFGKALNTAINAAPGEARDAEALLNGEPAADAQTADREQTITALTKQAAVFELADDDERLAALFLDAVRRPSDPAAAARFGGEAGKRVALAGRILIEQCDFLLAVWDGLSTANAGGTGHTVLAALNTGTPVLWIDPATPENWTILHSPEAVTAPASETSPEKQAAQLSSVIDRIAALSHPESSESDQGFDNLEAEKWRARSTIRSHAFRRIEAVFAEKSWRKKLSSMRQVYERPDAIAEGSAKPLLDDVRALSGDGTAMADRIASQILTRFAWLDGISARLSDRHRSGMTLNFILGAAAIIGGIMYLPLVDPAQKWIFAAIELLFLLAILINTAAGQRMRLHRRWFETRRAAEYLRHSPMLCVMGVARPASEWPHGSGSWWPEWYVRGAVRNVGLPDARVDKAYLRGAIKALRDHHVEPQLRYHRAKAIRLARVHHGLDTLAERLFISAVGFVALYLALAVLAAFLLIDPQWLAKMAKWFTVIAVAMPTLGGALAGIRYFGDFERFSEISQITAEKLEIIASRIEAILSAPESAMTYDHASDIVRASDDAVFAEIQNWQSVFSGKVIAVPA